MMHLELSATVRLMFPATSRPKAQSLYFFNTYRSGSSVIEAAALAFAKLLGLTPVNLTSMLYKLGIEYFDTMNYSSNSAFLQNTGQLLKATEFGGYLFYGFREVPIGFSNKFLFNRAAILIVRDPRDIGISQYFAVSKHSTGTSIEERQIIQLRQDTKEQSLDQFILSNETISFLRRISENYAPMIHRGLPVVQYEDLFQEGQFSISQLCMTIEDNFQDYLTENFSISDFVKSTNEHIANSKALKDHKTSASIHNYLQLSDATLKTYTDKLEKSLDILQYHG